MSIGSNIKKWREIRNLKQSELAEMIGVSDKTVSSWEINRTEPKMGMVEKISAALNCKKTDIIGTDEHDTTISQNDEFNFDIKLSEIEHIKKYRSLDEHGKYVVDFLLDAETERLSASNTTTDC